MRRTSWTALAGALGASVIASLGCSSGPGSTGGSHYDPSSANGDTSSGTGSGTTTPQPGPGGTPPASSGDDGGAADAGTALLDDRVLNYGEALRTASLKLVGDLPTLAQIQALAAATTPAQQATIYAADIQAMLADPRFASQMIQYFRDTFKTGEPYPGAANGAPSFDTAATFAAMVTVNGQPFTDILTASTGTCPTFANGTFTAANCTNNAPTAGVLTDPGIQAQYFEHMAFRRVRWVQETFVCSPFPAEYAATPVEMGQALYTSPWPFDSIAGGPDAQINFQDTSSVICANCHTTENHIAPLFAYFDANGQYHAGQIQVQTPVTVPVTSVLTDWLPAGQGYAWRNGTPVTDLPSLGQAIAADPDVPQCAINRIWDWAFNRGDIVLNLATIPNDVTASYVADFTKNGMNLKQAIQEIFTSDDFVRF